MFQLDAARVSRCFPGSGAGSLRQFFCQCQGSVPVLKLAQQADGGEAGVVEPVPVPAFVGGTSAGRMGQNGGIVIQCLFLFVHSFIELGPLGQSLEFPGQSQVGRVQDFRTEVDGLAKSVRMGIFLSYPGIRLDGEGQQAHVARQWGGKQVFQGGDALVRFPHAQQNGGFFYSGRLGKGVSPVPRVLKMFRAAFSVLPVLLCWAAFPARKRAAA